MKVNENTITIKEFAGATLSAEEAKIVFAILANTPVCDSVAHVRRNTNLTKKSDMEISNIVLSLYNQSISANIITKANPCY